MDSLDLTDGLHPKFLVEGHILNIDGDALSIWFGCPVKTGFFLDRIGSPLSSTGSTFGTLIFSCDFLL